MVWVPSWCWHLLPRCWSSGIIIGHWGWHNSCAVILECRDHARDVSWAVHEDCEQTGRSVYFIVDIACCSQSFIKCLLFCFEDRFTPQFLRSKCTSACMFFLCVFLWYVTLCFFLSFFSWSQLGTSAFRCIFYVFCCIPDAFHTEKMQHVLLLLTARKRNALVWTMAIGILVNCCPYVFDAE